MSQKRAREVDDELAAVRRELKRERAAARAAAREWVLPVAARRSILVMFDQAQGDVEPAVTYLHIVARERHWPTKSDEELRGVVEEIFLDATSSADALESYASLVDTAAPSDPDAMRVALRYTEEWRVVVWAREQNTQKGLAPSTTQLLHSHEAHAALLPEAVRPPTHSARTSSASRKWGVRLRRRWGAEFGRIKVRERVPLNVMRDKATAAWQWWNYLETRTPPGTSLLRINLDETAVCLHQGGRSGNIFVTKQSRAGLVESATLGQRRTYLTHVAFICDRTDLQPRLPQILIGNEATLPLHALPALRAMCPPNVFLIRQKSSWNNNTLCANIIGRLKRALAPHAAGCQLVLILDTVKLHSADAVLHACRRWDVWPLFCPAKLTWLLQPLDTHAFGLYKHVLGSLPARAGARRGWAGRHRGVPALRFRGDSGRAPGPPMGRGVRQQWLRPAAGTGCAPRAQAAGARQRWPCTVGATDGGAASPVLSAAFACALRAGLAPRAWPARGAGEGVARRRREGSTSACEGCTRSGGVWPHALWRAVQAARAGAMSCTAAA